MENEKDALILELRDLFCTANPNSEAFEVFMSSGCPVTAIEELVAINCHYLSAAGAIEAFSRRYDCTKVAEDKLIKALGEIIEYATHPKSETDYAFISKLARLHLISYSYIYEREYEYPELSKPSKLETALLDLASGYDFSNFLAHVSTSNMYYSVDKSMFVAEVIRQKAESLNLSNVFAINKDVMDLRREDLSVADIEIIRAKNIFTYIPRYLDVFQQHLDWLCDGGRFIFAEQSAERSANSTFLHKLVTNKYFALVSNGWSVGYQFGQKENPMALNSIWFTKTQEADVNREMTKLQGFFSELKRIYQF